MYYQKSDSEDKWLPNVSLTGADFKISFFIATLMTFMKN